MKNQLKHQQLHLSKRRQTEMDGGVNNGNKNNKDYYRKKGAFVSE